MRALLLSVGIGAWVAVLGLGLFVYTCVQELRTELEAHVGWLIKTEKVRLSVNSATKHALESRAGTGKTDLGAVHDWLVECHLATELPLESTTPEARRGACDATQIWLRRLDQPDTTALSLSQIQVSATLSALVSEVRRQTAEISTRLGRLWTWLSVLGAALVFVTGALGVWLVVYRRRAELARRAERKQLEMEILEIEQRERARIGADLHDGLAQQLVAISLFQQSLENKLSARQLPEAEAAGEIGGFISEAIAQSRALARGLAPAGPTVKGLGPALEDLASDTETLFGVPCEVRTTGTDFHTRHEVSNHLFRIAQEAVHNAAKHAGAKQIFIELSSLDPELVLTVTDDGVGIPDAAAEGEGKGIGLRLMKHRADLIDGSLSIRPGPDGGTTVACRFLRDRQSDRYGLGSAG